MIPYVEIREVPLGGGLSLAVFGSLVAVGVVVGVRFAEARARARRVPEPALHAAILWTVVPGFLAAHLVALVGSSPGAWPQLAWELWNGMDSFGGFAGALLGFLWHHARSARGVRLAIAEILVQALAVGWVFGRLGCTLVHDHIGSPSGFWLAIAFPDGARHDLGFYEFLFTALVLVPVVVALNRRPRPPGTTIAAMALLYAPARFLGDFLRNTDLPSADARHLGLTFAQYGCIALAGIGIAFAARTLRNTEGPGAT